jgi:hypothetical protein
MCFDRIVTRTFDGGAAEYGILDGNDTVVFIKTEAGCSPLGEDKYFKLAKRLHDIRGATVVCAANLCAGAFQKADADILREIVAAKDGKAELFFIGVCEGALDGLYHATQRFTFERILLVNLPLLLEIQRTKAALLRIPSEIRFVFGEKEPAVKRVPELKHAIDCLRYAPEELCPPKAVKIEVIKGADNRFTGMLDDFLALGERIFEGIALM